MRWMLLSLGRIKLTFVLYRTTPANTNWFHSKCFAALSLLPLLPLLLMCSSMKWGCFAFIGVNIFMCVDYTLGTVRYGSNRMKWDEIRISSNRTDKRTKKKNANLPKLPKKAIWESVAMAIVINVAQNKKCCMRSVQIAEILHAQLRQWPRPARCRRFASSFSL